VDIVWEHLGGNGKRLLDLFATVVTLAFLIPMAWMTWVKVSSTGTQATSDLRLPMVPFYVVSAIGATVAVVLAAKRAWELFQDRLSPESGAETGHGS
jgi:TRAP-type C4-dicarboxylate transport system permease small subunit